MVEGGASVEKIIDDMPLVDEGLDSVIIIPALSGNFVEGIHCLHIEGVMIDDVTNQQLRTFLLQ